MATPQDYQIGTAALAAIIKAAIAANVPQFLMSEVAEHQAMIDQIEAQGAKAVIDAVDAARAKTNQAT
jgi:hypothetical protein